MNYSGEIYPQRRELVLFLQLYAAEDTIQFQNDPRRTTSR